MIIPANINAVANSDGMNALFAAGATKSGAFTAIKLKPQSNGHFETIVAKRPDDWSSHLKKVFSATDWSRDNEEWDGVVVSEGNVLNRRQNQRDLTELLRVKIGVATAEETLRRLVHQIGHNRPNLALIARLRAADSRAQALEDVAELERRDQIHKGASDELRELMRAVYPA